MARNSTFALRQPTAGKCTGLVPRLLAIALALGACSSSSPDGSKSAGGAGGAGTGGSSAAGSGGDTGGSGGSGGESTAGSGGAGSGTGGSAGDTAGTGGSSAGTPDAAAESDASPGGSDASAVDQAPSAPSGSGVLYVGGEMPMVGVDGQIHAALKARNLDVQDVIYSAATPAMADGKQLVILSYSLLSSSFKTDGWAAVKAPIIVLEHNLLPLLGMSKEHSFQTGVTALTLTSDDPTLSAGLSGDVTVYSKTGEFFWGSPGPGAIKVATIKGNPARVVTFAYPAGAMMTDGPAPGKRVQLFVAVHAPPPNPTEFLGPDGIKLLGGAIDWCIK